MTDKIETRTVEIPVYRDEDGNPSCNRCFMNNKGVCNYLCEAIDINYLTLSYKPNKDCPLWKNKGDQDANE